LEAILAQAEWRIDMRVVKVKGEVDAEGFLRLSLPTQLPPGPIEAVIVLGSPAPTDDGHKYDFADLTGKLNWNGDPVAAQRKLRDEW
jgi:hypothetical protein